VLAHIAALETELARYAHKYGIADEARRLLKEPQQSETPDNFRS
jgi:hypothetical protein